jgi:hypothetical protein
MHATATLATNFCIYTYSVLFLVSEIVDVTDRQTDGGYCELYVTALTGIWLFLFAAQPKIFPWMS